MGQRGVFFSSLRCYHLHKPLLKIMLINSHSVIQQAKKGITKLFTDMYVRCGGGMLEGLCGCVFKAAERYHQSQLKKSYSENQGASASVFTAVGD